MHWSLTMIIPLVVFGVFVALGYRFNRQPHEGGGHQGILVQGCLICVGMTVGNWAALYPMGMALAKLHGESIWLIFGQWGVAALLTVAQIWCVVTLDERIQKKE